MNGGALIGLVGMLLLVSAWVPQTWETIKTRKCPLNMGGFILIYVTASTLLTVYSYIIGGDWIFFALNFLAAFQSAINLTVKLMEKKR